MHSSNLHAPTPASLAASVEVTRRENRLLHAGILLTLALACAGCLAIDLVDPDLWGHIRYAEDWLATGELPRTASHTFSAPDHPWINHEILAELAIAKGYRHLGINGLLAAKCLLGMAIVGLMVSVARRQGVSLLLTWALMLLVCANLHPFFVLRPQLMSFGLFGLVLWLLERGFRNWQISRSIDWKFLWSLPIVFALWANTHGAFVLGLAVVGALLGGRIVEKIVEQQASLRECLLLALTVCGCIAATLLNPYGIGLHHWLIQSLSRPRPEITEWLSPSTENVVFWPWVALLVVAVLSILMAQRRRDWVKFGILMLVAWQSALHMRHIAFLALLCGFWLPEYVNSAVTRLRLERLSSLASSRYTTIARRAAIVTLLAVACLLSFRIDRQFHGLPVSRNTYPLDAVQFMADRGLQGRLVVSFNWAQYSVAALAPDVQVAFDGRFRTCYPQDVIDMNFDFLLGEFGGRRYRCDDSGPLDATRVLRHGTPDLVLLDRRYAHAVSVMQEQKSCWSLLYRDRVAEIWGRRERYDMPTSSSYMPLALRVQDPRPRDGAVLWPALPTREVPGQLAAGAAIQEHLGS